MTTAGASAAPAISRHGPGERRPRRLERRQTARRSAGPAEIDPRASRLGRGPSPSGVCRRPDRDVRATSPTRMSDATAGMTPVPRVRHEQGVCPQPCGARARRHVTRGRGRRGSGRPAAASMARPATPRPRTIQHQARAAASHRANHRSSPVATRARQARIATTPVAAITPTIGPSVRRPVRGQARILRPTNRSRETGSSATDCPPPARNASAARVSAKSKRSSWTASGV
jgi:hypothetical protein